MSEFETPKSLRYKIGKILETWWFKALEVIAFIILIPKLLPEKWLVVAKDTGWALIIILGGAVLSLLVINYLLTLGYAKEIAHREVHFSEILSGIKSKFNEKIIALNEENKLLEKKSRYADVLPMLNAAFQELHNALRRNYEDKSKYHEPFVVFCQNLEKVFSRLTGEDCHVCIKITVFPNDQIPAFNKIEKHLENLQVKTYCRSSSFSTSRNQVDQSKISHLIKENSDFEDVFKNKDECFFCNDLAMIDGYKNSSFKLITNSSFVYFPKGTPFEEKSKNWPLKYRATIVTPISPSIKIEKEEHIILGLLCVDSNTPEVFHPDIDKHIMIGCADGLYNSFKKLFNPPASQSSNKSKR